MNAKVTDECISCERCVDICPDVFEMGDEYAQVQMDPIPEEQEESVRQAAEECPVGAIILE